MLQPTLGMDPCFKNASKIPSMPKRNEKILIGGGGAILCVFWKTVRLAQEKGLYEKKSTEYMMQKNQCRAVKY